MRNEFAKSINTEFLALTLVDANGKKYRKASQPDAEYQTPS